jgi:hypothetical protein
MVNAPKQYAELGELVTHFRDLDKKFILLFAYNGIGKTRLSMTFKEVGKNMGEADTLYFNAFTEDLFSWDNDLDNDTERRFLINKYSRFINGVRELDMDNKIRPLLHRYYNFNFIIDYNYKDKDNREYWAVNFIRETIVNKSPVNIEYVKISRGEENLFIWCFFLAVAQLAIDREVEYKWVKNIYIDDPISSLDDNNTIALAHHLASTLKAGNGEVKTIISTHHALFFNVLHNEFGNAKKYLLTRNKDIYILRDTTDSPFLYHISVIQELKTAIDSGRLYTYHFSLLRTILEKAANFHGFTGFADCLVVNDDDEQKTLFNRMVSVMNHGGYSYFEPREMLEENKIYFKQIFDNFKNNYKFNKELFEDINTEEPS